MDISFVLLTWNSERFIGKCLNSLFATPNMLLYWTFLKYAADNDYSQFDFGRLTPGEGTYRFKAQWGASPENLHWYQFGVFSKLQSESYETPKDAGQAKFRNMAERAWSSLPCLVVNWLGPRIRKFISL